MQTDHSSLKYLLTSKHLSEQWARYLDTINQFDIEITWVPGAQQAISDFLSRARVCEMDSGEYCKQCRTKSERDSLKGSLRVGCFANRKFGMHSCTDSRFANMSHASIDSCESEQNLRTDSDASTCVVVSSPPSCVGTQLSW